MMIKLSKNEAEEACAYWLRGRKWDEQSRCTVPETPIAIGMEKKIVCKHTRGGVECVISGLKDEETS
jgi:hypothetical protein